MHPRPNKSSSPQVSPGSRPPLRINPTTLWEYPSQHYDSWIDDEGNLQRSKKFASTQGDQAYVGATPSWVIWQCLMRFTRVGDTIVDPMVGSGTTIDVCADLNRKAIGFDLAPTPDRPDIRQADARGIPLADESVDFVFIDPPYSTHVTYSDDPRCIGKLSTAGEDNGAAYYDAMADVLTEIHRILKNRRYMALYVSDSFQKSKGKPGGTFMPIGFHLLDIMMQGFKPVDIIAVVRHNQKLTKGNWRKAAEEGNFFLRGFNYLFLMKKEEENQSEHSVRQSRRSES